MDNEIKLSDKCISTNLSEKTSFKKNICIVENKFCTKYQFKKVRVVAIEKWSRKSKIREYFEIEMKVIYENLNSYLSTKSTIKGNI